VLGAVYVVGMPLVPGLRDIQLVEFLTSGLGLLLLLLVLPGGLAEGAFRLRDAVLRRVAARRGLHVPSLVADGRRPTAPPPLTATVNGGGADAAAEGAVEAATPELAGSRR
jgi:hypothetical protein